MDAWREGGALWLCCMALSVSEVYYLSGETLRQVCLERGLDHSGPVRELRQRLVEHIRSGPRSETGKCHN